MKRRVVMNMNKNTSKGKVVRQCTKDSKVKSSESVVPIAKKDKVLHPTLKCHEEVMSRLSQCTSEYCCNDIDNFSDKTESCQLNSHIRNKHQGKGINQASNPRRKVVNGLDSLPVVNRASKNVDSPKTIRSKSVPTIHKCKLEDYVDYVPIKLSSKEDTKNNLNQTNALKPNHNLETDKRKKSRAFRPTWDTLLKGESKEKLTPNETKLGLPSNLDIHDKNSMTDGSSSDWTSRKKQSSTNSFKDDNTFGKGDSGNLKTIAHTAGSDGLILSNFYGVEPVKTLDFLIKHLREKLCKQQNENLQNIISDMENVLLKISVESEKKPRSNQEEDKYVSSSNTPSPQSIQKSLTSGSVNHKETNPHMDIHQLQLKLEESCIFLQSLCMKQRQSCNNHTKEKELLTIQLAESRRLLAIAKSKEKDYEVTIGNLRLKAKEAQSCLEQQMQYSRELNNIVTNLRAENQVLRSHEETIRKLDQRVKELTQEKETLNSNLKDLEIERLKFLLERKENLNPVYTNKIKEKYNRPMELELNMEDKDVSSLSLTSEMNWSQDKNLIACSSQASSSPRHSPTPYNSWQHISAIHQPLQNIPHTFHNLKKKFSKKDPSPLDLELDSDSSLWGENFKE